MKKQMLKIPGPAGLTEEMELGNELIPENEPNNDLVHECQVLSYKYIHVFIFQFMDFRSLIIRVLVFQLGSQITYQKVSIWCDFYPLFWDYPH